LDQISRLPSKFSTITGSIWERVAFRVGGNEVVTSIRGRSNCRPPSRSMHYRILPDTAATSRFVAFACLMLNRLVTVSARNP